MWILVTMALAGDPPAIVAIRKRWKAVATGRGTMCVDLEEPGEIRLDLRLDWNPEKTQRPAIGTYGDTIDVYRNWCHPAFEGSVVKVVHRQNIAARGSSVTVLYDGGEPVFALDEGAERPEVRTYFAGGKAIRVVSRLGDRSDTTDAPTGPIAVYATRILAMAKGYAAQASMPESPPDHPWMHRPVPPRLP